MRMLGNLWCGYIPAEGSSDNPDRLLPSSTWVVDIRNVNDSKASPYTATLSRNTQTATL